MPWWSGWEHILPTRRSGSLEDGIESSVATRPRETSILEQPSEIETLLAHPTSPFENIDYTPGMLTIDPAALDALRDGCPVTYLVREHPDDVLTVLKEIAVAPLGTFTAKDSQVLAAFGKRRMLTRGMETNDDPFWDVEWQEILEKNFKSKEDRSNVSVGWEQNVTLGGYVVNLKNIAKRGDGEDLLDLLLKKYESGAAPGEIWEFPAIQAIVNYHWERWARKLLLLVFALFVVWTLSFFAYLYFYIDYNDGTHELSSGCQEQDDGKIGGRHRHPPNMDGNDGLIPKSIQDLASHPKGEMLRSVFNIICFSVMCPFAIEEYWTIFSLGRRWLSPGNLLDVGAINLQAFIFACECTKLGRGRLWFGYVLACQAIFLSIRLLRFLKLLGGGTTFLDTALAVIYEVRYWLAYIVFTGISASFCLAAMYKEDEVFRNKNGHTEFKSVWSSLVTTFQIIFGNFTAKFIFDAQFQVLTFLFYFGFQILMTITVLNLIIAAMADAYSKQATRKISQFYSGRAYLISELAALHLPQCMTTEIAPFIHFLVVEKTALKQRNSLSAGELSKNHPKGSSSYPKTPAGYPRSHAFHSRSDQELRKRIEELSSKIDALANLILSLKQTTPPQIQQSM